MRVSFSYHCYINIACSLYMYMYHLDHTPPLPPETLDYQSPIGDFMLLPSQGTQRPRACLTGTVLSDDLLEAQEEFTARLVGVVSDGGVVDADPDRVTFNPRDTRILINDDVNESESLCTVYP